MIYYRSDWPEVGLPTDLSEESFFDQGLKSERKGLWVIEKHVAKAVLRWIARKNKFESELYGFQIWDIYFEVNDIEGYLLGNGLDNDLLIKSITEVIEELISSPPWDKAYISAKLVKNEPLYRVLARFGFDEVEHRRLYTCKIGDLKGDKPDQTEHRIKLLSISEVSNEKIPDYHQQILEICRESFESSGHTRHFLDAFLLERRPGIDYILSAMDLNFKHVDPQHFLIAEDSDYQRVCGFTAIGKRPGPKGEVYTQLLSAVSKKYRGRGIHRGLTRMISRIFPPDARLLNVIHVANQKIQRAYMGSGRVHLADTVILRRIFS